MTDRPILFSASMVQALLAGRKTQTRRVLNPQPQEDIGLWMAEHDIRFVVGDRLFVREAIIGARGYDKDPPTKWGNKPVWYVADGEPDRTLWWHLSDRKRPGIHMPRWLSRLTLTVTDVRVQRLQEISDADAVAEGIMPCGTSDAFPGMPMWGLGGEQFGNSQLAAYSLLWDDINDARGYGWDTNPWVVAVSFDVEKINIDAAPGAKP